MSTLDLLARDVDCDVHNPVADLVTMICEVKNSHGSTRPIVLENSGLNGIGQPSRCNDSSDLQ
jgi:hypothetical protein